MFAGLKRISLWIVGFFTHPPEQEDCVPVLPRKTKKDGSDIVGEFYFRDGILDRLDEYFDVLRRMRLSDPDNYALYRQAGGVVLPGSVWSSSIEEPKIDPWFLKTRPSFGAAFFFLGESQEHDTMFPKAVMFRKYERSKAPVGIQRAKSGDVYVVTVYWDDVADARWAKYAGKRGVPQEFAINLTDSGEIIPLRHFVSGRQKVQTRHGIITLPSSHWKMDSGYGGMLTFKERALGDSLRQWFALVANEWQGAAMSMIKVRVESGPLAASFAVDVTRTPYFFKDRDISVGTNRRKKIFHIVRTHSRTRAGGQESFVKTHFRGERQFRWNGYDVSITVPGRDHVSFSELNIGAMDSDSVSGREGLETREIMTMGDMGKTIANIERHAV